MQQGRVDICKRERVRECCPVEIHVYCVPPNDLYGSKERTVRTCEG
jgi:hypothetical protein